MPNYAGILESLASNPKLLKQIVALREKMLAGLEPIENVAGSMFRVPQDGKGLPSGERAISSLYQNPDAVYPVYHGAHDVSDTPLRPYSEAHNDVTAFLGEREDPRALAYGTTNPRVAAIHAYGLHDIAKSPNLRAYVGRDLPQLSRRDFLGTDIRSVVSALTRGDKDKLLDLAGAQSWSSLRPRTDAFLTSRLQEAPESLLGGEFNALGEDIAALKAQHIATLPKNYIQTMTDLAGFTKSGNPIQKRMPQLMLTDPDEAIRNGQLIPLKGEYAQGGPVKPKYNAQNPMTHYKSSSQDRPIGAGWEDVKRGAKNWAPDIAQFIGSIPDAATYATRRIANGQGEQSVPSLGWGPAMARAVHELQQQLGIEQKRALSQGQSVGPVYEPSARESAAQFANPLQFVNPASVARGAGLGGAEVIARAMQSEGPLAQMLTAGIRPMGVIKQKGGNWLSGSVEDALRGLKRGNPEMRERYARLGVALPPGSEGPTAVNSWIDKALTKYVKNDMATPEDPIRALAEAWPAKQETLLAAQQAKINKLQAKRDIADPRSYPGIDRDIAEANKEKDMIAGQRGLHYDPVWAPDGEFARRFADGLEHTPHPEGPGSRLGKTKLAQDWEDLTDQHLDQYAARDIPQTTNFGKANRVDNPWLEKVPGETPVYGIPGDIPSNLGFDHLIDELSNSINPESGLPRHLMFPADRLDKVSVPQAVQRVSDINAWRAAQKAEADQARANNAAVVLHKEYPDDPNGMKWVQLKAGEKKLPEGYTLEYGPGNGGAYVTDPSGEVVARARSASEALTKVTQGPLADALKYEGDTMGHCVGGYCDDVASGRSNIFSLRDAKGQPHVTIETDKPLETSGTEEEFVDAVGRRPNDFEELDNWAQENGFEIPEEGILPGLPRIVQIKGKGNAKPHDDYLPYVQDFVKSGQWSDVGDLQNSGLERIGPWKQELLKAGAAPERVEQFYTQLGHPEFVTKQQLSDATPGLSPQYDYKMLAEYLNNQAAPEGFAQGGSVTLPKEIRTLQDLRNIIASLS